MLKNKRLLFLGLMVIAGSACVTPTHASSASPVLFVHVQPTGPFGAKDEHIIIHNNGPAAVDITGWCVTNKAQVAFACVAARMVEGGEERALLPGYSSATIASWEYMGARAYAPEVVSHMYEVTNQSSGSIVASADTLSLVDDDGTVIDQWGWATTPGTNRTWSRAKVLESPIVYAQESSPANWSAGLFIDLPVHGLEYYFQEADNTDEEEEEGGESAPPPDPEEPPVPVVPVALRISELLPNADGADAGKEFIEIYNAHDQDSYLLDGFSFRLGESAPKWYTLPSGLTIAPGEYLAFTDSLLGFTLPNTQGTVQLYKGDQAIGEPISYYAPKDDQSWALIDGQWQYTKSPTPGAENKISPAASAIASSEKAAATPKPCASNQFRNRETGRCKLIASAATAPTPCKPGQVRNPETNRCRTTAAATAPAPCKEGQERNPETNRCRNIIKMPTADHGVKGVQMQAAAQLNWYYWAGIVGIIAAILGYAGWEWRQEIASLTRRVRGMLVKR